MPDHRKKKISITKTKKIIIDIKPGTGGFLFRQIVFLFIRGKFLQKIKLLIRSQINVSNFFPAGKNIRMRTYIFNVYYRTVIMTRRKAPLFPFIKYALNINKFII